METIIMVKEEGPEFPEKIYAVDYAGYHALQDGPYYEDNKLLDIDENPDAEKFAEEVCRRYNNHKVKVKRIEELEMRIVVIGSALSNLIDAIEFTEIGYKMPITLDEAKEAILNSLDTENKV